MCYFDCQQQFQSRCELKRNITIHSSYCLVPFSLDFIQDLDQVGRINMPSTKHRLVTWTFLGLFSFLSIWCKKLWECQVKLYITSFSSKSKGVMEAANLALHYLFQLNRQRSNIEKAQSMWKLYSVFFFKWNFICRPHIFLVSWKFGVI
jgi:hypothetical protein